MPDSAHWHPPIKRHRSLQPFSRDHYTGLVQAQRLLKSAEGSAARRHSALTSFQTAWQEEIAPHFADEERLLIPLMRSDDVDRLTREHTALRSLALEVDSHAQAVDPPSEFVRQLGQRLNDHIRWEERELFPRIEQAASAEALEWLAPLTAAMEVQRPRSQSASRESPQT
ncbi:MAG: hemerythrin domain-containing protein [Bacillota bacterium]